MLDKLFSKSLFGVRSTCILLLFSTITILPVYAQDFTVQPDTTEVEIGYIKLTSEVDSFYVVINRDFKNPRFFEFADSDSLQLQAGINHLRIIKPYHFDIVMNTKVFTDSTRWLGINPRRFADYERGKYLSSFPRLHWGGKYLIRSDHDTELSVGDSLISTGHLLFDSPGSYRLKGYSGTGEEFSKNIELSDDRLFEVVDFYFRPERRWANLLSVIPGGAQFYKREPYKAVVALALLGSVSGLALNQELNLRSSIREYNELSLAYITISEPVRVLEIGDEMDREVQNQKRFARNRNWLLIGASAIYVLNIFDGRRVPRMGFREEIDLDPYLDFEYGNIGGGVQVRRRF